MPYFSIIIPVYNVESYITQCIASLVEQTFHDFEVIVIDDGSTDSSYKLIQDFSKKDSRFFLYRKNNEGLSITRNFGLEKACGQFIIFLDGDDYLDKKALGIIADKIIQHNLDVLFFSAKIIYDDIPKLQRAYDRLNEITNKLMSGSAFFTKSINHGNYYPSACLYATKKSLSKTLSFYPGVHYEDNLYTTQLLLNPYCQRVMAINDHLYIRRVRSNSITTKAPVKKDSYDYLTIFDQLILFQKDMAEEFDPKTSIAYQRLLLSILKESFSKLFQYKKSASLSNRFFYLGLAVKHCQIRHFPSFILMLIAPRLLYWLRLKYT